MIYVDTIQELINSWKERLENNDEDLSYNCALSECTYELEELLNKIFDEEASVRDKLIKEWLEEDAADSHLSSMERDEHIA